MRAKDKGLSPISRLNKAGIGFDGGPLKKGAAVQSRRKSLEETVVSTMVGFVLSTIINFAIVPHVLDTKVSMSQNLVLVAIFTVASIARGYFVRRIYAGK